MRRIIINTLKRFGYDDVVEAVDGKDALAKMKVESFNFIIADWNMPEMDGFEFVKVIRSMDEFKDIPVLMVTTRSIKEDIMEAMRIGVNNYVVKPFTPETLKQKIDQVLSM